MGLEQFTDDSSTSNTSTNGNTTTTKQKSSKSEPKNSDNDPFKVVGSGSGKKKVFETKEDWKSAVDFIQNEMDMSVNQVMSMNNEKRHTVLHKAIMKSMGAEPESFHPKRECAICDNVFIFPNYWRFVKYRGETFCPTHTLEECKEEVEEINDIH